MSMPSGGLIPFLPGNHKLFLADLRGVNALMRAYIISTKITALRIRKTTTGVNALVRANIISTRVEIHPRD